MIIPVFFFLLIRGRLWKDFLQFFLLFRSTPCEQMHFVTSAQSSHFGHPLQDASLSRGIHMFARLVGVDISLNIPKFFRRECMYHILAHECIDNRLKIYESLKSVSPRFQRKDLKRIYSVYRYK